VLCVGSGSLIELMVSRAYYVHVLLAIYVEVVLPLGVGCIVQPVAFDAVSRVDEEQVSTLIVRSLP
jgi:hypothetical protein